jgi:HK97 family phage prohead protease
MRTLKAVAGKPASIDREKRIISAIISTDSVDRDKDIVVPKGGRFDSYLKNPVVLWAHDSGALPIGKVETLEVGEHHVGATIQFAETQLAKEVFSLYADGFLNAWSIGFIAPFAKREVRVDEQTGHVIGYKINEWEMLELSACPVPANPEALARAMKSVSVETAAAIERATVKGFRHDNTTAEDEGSWASVDKTALPLKAFAWEAPDTDEMKKASWKFPHHFVLGGTVKGEDGTWTDGALRLHASGLNAAWAAAMGARSGQEAPAAVVSHLQRHRKALGLDDAKRFARISSDSAGVRVTREAVGDEHKDGDALFAESPLTLTDGALAKSITERSGKIPVDVTIGDETKVEITAEILQEQDGKVKEAKVHAIHVTLGCKPKPDAAPAEPSTPREEPDRGAVATYDAGKILRDLELKSLALCSGAV